MYKKRYPLLAVLSLILGACAICLYLPYTIEAFNIKGFGWLDFARDIFKSNYYDILIYFAIFLLLWFIVLNIVTLPSHLNLPKLLFKFSIICALVLPLMYVLALKYDFVLEFWIKYISSNIKSIAYILLCISSGSFVLGLVCNFTKSKRANLHHIFQALIMCAVLTIFIAVQGWCGWNVNGVKMFGVLMGMFAIYLPLSSIILLICAKN